MVFYSNEYVESCESNSKDQNLSLKKSCVGVHSCGFYCSKTISALAPIAHVASSSYSVIEDVISDFLSGSLEDHVLCSLSLFLEGKASGRDSINFLALLGLPTFQENYLPGSLRHPNIAPILSMLKSSDHINIILPKAPYTLENILHYSPDVFNSEWRINFLVYQLFSALAYMHGLGVSHGHICPSNVMLTDLCWILLKPTYRPGLGFNSSSTGDEYATTALTKVGCCVEDCTCRGIFADLKLSPSLDWHRDFNLWWRGEMSNFEYLLVLNKLAGRRWGDHTFHTVMPWVVDFSSKPDENSDVGWRDLGKSKWRLAKGDEQLDFTYSTSEVPHHISDECLSELAVCSYKARRLPLSVLRMAVRSVYEPNEYPSTMQRLYQWTPDECIPEFYCDPQIFKSQHSGMMDLAVPSWAGSSEEFIQLHRDALESDRVSCQLHHWIDITFGYKMSGQAAVSAKNVMLHSSEPKMPRSAGRRQLFIRPHPVRRAPMRKSSDKTNDMRRCNVNGVGSESSLLSETVHLLEFEEASAFSEHASYLSANYDNHQGHLAKEISSLEEMAERNFKKQINSSKHYGVPFHIDANYILEQIEASSEGSAGYQDLMLWRQKSSSTMSISEDTADDIFFVGCILAELHLKRPLFDSISMDAYMQGGTLPGLMQELPPHTRVTVEACVERNWMRYWLSFSCPLYFSNEIYVF